MRILFSRDDGSEYLFLRPGAPVCLDSVHQRQEPVVFASRHEAANLLRDLARNPAAVSALRSLLPTRSGYARLATEPALRRLAETLWRGELLVHRRRYARTAYFLEHTPGTAAPVAPPVTARPTPIEEVDTFSPAHDAPAQAKVLKDAAASGVPFCEECQKLK